jgi:hypothetical protein
MEVQVQVQAAPQQSAPKKRGRPSKKTKVATGTAASEADAAGVAEPKTPKKRGRKPKGGQLVDIKSATDHSSVFEIQNVIVHLKCKSQEVITNNNKNKITFMSLDEKTDIGSHYKASQTAVAPGVASGCDHSPLSEPPAITGLFPPSNQCGAVRAECAASAAEPPKTKGKKQPENTLEKKLTDLQKHLTGNAVETCSSACFWCSYSFENPAIYIPKFVLNDVYHVYGCFCSPECACGFLMNEHIDESMKYERYALLCNLYAKIFDYKKSITPAPDPYYTLEKYFGNMTIGEYRALSSTNRFLFVVEKPLTREIPEIEIEYADKNVAMTL